MTPSDSTNSSASKPHPLRGYCYIAAAALCWSVSASLGRAAFTGRLGAWAMDGPDIGPTLLAESRTAISFLILAPILLARRGTRAFAMSKSELLRMALLGVGGLAASNYFYYLAIQKTNVATAIILQYTAPIWVLLYMVARRLQRATAQRVISVFLAVVGCALSVGMGNRLQLNTAGVVAAELAGIAFAYYSIGIASYVERHDRWTLLFYLLMFAALFWLVINPPWKMTAYGPGQWVFLTIFAVTSGLVPFAFYIAGLHHLDATRGIVTSSLEPVFSIAIAALALGEGVGPLQVVGIAVVLVATVLVQMPSAGEKAAMVEPIE